jgi:hypothetical protein
LKAIPPKPLFAALPKLFDSKQGPVRDAAKSITVGLPPLRTDMVLLRPCRSLGMAAVEPTLLTKMSDIMRKDVEKAVADAPGKPQPEVSSAPAMHMLSLIQHMQPSPLRSEGLACHSVMG